MRRKQSCRHQKAFCEGGIQYASPNIIGEKSDCGTSSFSPLLFYIATPSQAIDTHSRYGIIQASKMQTPTKPWLDKRLHFPFLEKGAMPSATNRPPVHNCTLKISYRTGGNNQLGPQEKANQQFRYSAARNRAHRPVYSPRHPRLLRKRRRSAGVPGVAGSA